MHNIAVASQWFVIWVLKSINMKENPGIQSQLKKTYYIEQKSYMLELVTQFAGFFEEVGLCHRQDWCAQWDCWLWDTHSQDYDCQVLGILLLLTLCTQQPKLFETGTILRTSHCFKDTMESGRSSTLNHNVNSTRTELTSNLCWLLCTIIVGKM